MPLPQLRTNFNVLQPDVGKQAVRAAQVGNFLAQQKDAPLNRRIKEAQLKNILAERKRAEESEKVKQRKRVADVINVEGQNLIRAFEAPTKEIGAALLNKIDPDSTISWGGGFITIENEKKGYKLRVRQADAVDVAKMLANPNILDDKQGVEGLSNIQDLVGYLGGTGGELTITEQPKTVETEIAEKKKKIAAGVVADPAKTAARATRGEQRAIEKEEATTLKNQQSVNSKITKLDLEARKLISSNIAPSALAELIRKPWIAGKKLSDKEVKEVVLLYRQEIADLLPSATQDYRDKYKGIKGISYSDPMELFLE